MKEYLRNLNWLYRNIGGLRAAWHIGIYPLFYRDRAKGKTAGEINYFGKYAQKMPQSQPAGTSIDRQAPIWTCWWQGKDNMPEIVRICHTSLLRHAGEHPVHLITLDNYQDYVTIPSYILRKVKDGIISYTHFSDILRFCLLSRYGGLWLDATIFVTGEIKEFPFPLFSLKQPPMDNRHISMYRWTSFCLGGCKANPLYLFMKEVYFQYWKSAKDVLEYLMIDTIIATAYERIGAVRKMIDALPYNNCRLYELSYILNQAYDEQLYREITSDTQFHKFTWKADFAPRNSSGEQTLYGHLQTTLTTK